MFGYLFSNLHRIWRCTFSFAILAFIDSLISPLPRASKHDYISRKLEEFRLLRIALKHFYKLKNKFSLIFNFFYVFIYFSFICSGQKCIFILSKESVKTFFPLVNIYIEIKIFIHFLINIIYFWVWFLHIEANILLKVNKIVIYKHCILHTIFYAKSC